MVSRTPTKAPSPSPGAGNVTPTKSTPSHGARRPRPQQRRRSAAKRRGSPLRSIASAPAAVAATVDRSIRSCRRRLLKLFARLAVLGSPRKRRAVAAGFQRLRSSSSPPPPPPPPRQQAQSAALPPPPSPGTRTLFLDLDETLIHSQTDPPPRFDFAVRPVIGGQPVTFYVAKRPGLEAFLRAAAGSFEVVVFTAGLQEYASLVLDRLDPDGDLFAHRLYRGACRDAGDGRLVKDLAATGRPLYRAVIVDDNPNAYALQPENAVPVAPFVDDHNDQELQRVMAFLDVTAGFDDTREAIRYYKDLVTAT
jgi:carboxy-terminal domain RNA polymerase II polypeptide A small phosphatase